MNEVIFNAKYIMAQTGIPDALCIDTPASLFRRRFQLESCGKATISVVGLGYARFYLNGKEITEDKFLSPVSDYTKNVWYNTYDVTDLLCEGENVAAVICGNGFYNEGLETPWHHNLAEWRDYPKFLLCLKVDGVPILVSDGSWLCTLDSFIPFNQLRIGETFDARLYDPAWTTTDYDDSAWNAAFEDDNPPKGVLMECSCEPIRELEIREPERIFQNGDAYVVDFGKNMAGYAQITVKQNAGDRIVLRYAEEYLEEERRIDNGQMETMYRGQPFQVDTLICSGDVDTYKPYFTYHGFRYVQIEGLREAPKKESLRAYFVHQDLKRKSSFESSNEILNFIYEAGIRSTYSNLHYALTDCPTREKLGWTNDAQATAEQTLINFDILAFYRKWYTDILLSVEEDGSMPGIVPSPKWGLDCGPVCDCLLYELPYRVYLYTGNPTMLIEGREQFKTYLKGFDQRLKDGTHLWLADWTGHDNSKRIPQRFVLDFYRIKSLRVTLLAEQLANGTEVGTWSDQIKLREREFMDAYLDENGYSTIEEQSSLAMQICFGLYRDFDKLKDQLKRTLERDEFRLTCGMVGVQYLYEALSRCGLQDYAYKIITESDPGYRLWYSHGATTLWERWDGVKIHSHNHHMFSNILGWFYTGLLGIAPVQSHPGFEKIELSPSFVSDMSFCQGWEDTVRGRIEAKWERKDGEIKYTVTIPETVLASYQGYDLTMGTNVFRICGETVQKIL